MPPRQPAEPCQPCGCHDPAKARGKNTALIATKPAQPRDSARLLVLRRDTQRLEHHHVSDLPTLGVFGANDLLVVNTSMRSRDPSHSREFCYMLVNQGRGYFKKGPLKVLPQYPSRGVYLLDANGSEIPDILILSSRGIHYLQGRGKWQFWKESRRRLPENVRFRELIFADIDDDESLVLLMI